MHQLKVKENTKQQTRNMQIRTNSINLNQKISKNRNGSVKPRPNKNIS